MLPTTTSTSTTTTTLPVFDIYSQLRSYRAIINTHFDLVADILRQALSGEQLSATLAELELSRALAIAQFAAALVRIGCAPAPVGAPTATASETPPEPAPTGDASEPPPGSALPDGPALTSWTVGPGDGLSSVAENTVGHSLGRPASDAEIEDYLALLIEVNRASLADPTNPDLIFSGQVLVVPAPGD